MKLLLLLVMLIWGLSTESLRSFSLSSLVRPVDSVVDNNSVLPCSSVMFSLKIRLPTLCAYTINEFIPGSIHTSFLEGVVDPFSYQSDVLF